MTLRRSTSALLTGLACVPTLSACVDDAAPPTSRTGGQPREAGLALACEALIPADAAATLGWTGEATPVWESSSCVSTLDQGRIEVERRSFGAAAVDDLQAGANETFAASCDSIQNVEGVDERYQDQLDFMGPDFRACGTGFSIPGGYSSAVVKLDSGAVVLIMVRPRKGTDMSRIKAASTLLAGAARDHFTDPDTFVP